jgi:phosphate:Na+ symporter
MPLHSIPTLLGGILLFLYSLSRLNNVVQLAVGMRIRDYIRFTVRRKMNGFISGLFLTLLFQSSSATSLLVVSMVSSGLMSLSESLPVILGSDIGTTLIAQLVVWKITELSPIILLAGLVAFLLPEEKLKTKGEALFYFGLLLFGLMLLSRSADTFKESMFFDQAILGKKSYLSIFLLTLFFTLIVQSSAIPISMAIILAQRDLLGIDFALPVVLGANLGTTGTALLGSIVTGPEGKKVSLAHTFFKFAGVIILFPLLPFIVPLIEQVPVGAPQKIALFHFLFNLFISILFYPLSEYVGLGLEWLIPSKGRSLAVLPEYLDRSCLRNSEEALISVEKELLRQLLFARTMVEDSISLLADFKKFMMRNIRYLEFVVDNLQSEIIKYLWQISSLEMGERQSRRLFAYTSIVHDIERIGDHAVNIAEIAEIKRKKRTFFSLKAVDELRGISEKLKRSLETVTTLLERKEKLRAAELEEEIEETEKMVRDALGNHLERFYCKICQREAGPLFVDVLTNIGGILRHIRFISESLGQHDLLR